MSSHLRDGIVVPDRVAGHLALELCNTRAGWGGEQPREYLPDHRALLAWGLDNALVPRSATPDQGPDPSAGPSPDPSVLDHALRLRELAYPVLTGDRGPDQLRRLAAAILDVRTASTLVPDGPSQLHWRAGGTGAGSDAGADIVLAAALAVETLVTSTAIGDVGVCAGPGCGWLFLDPRHRRRWCSMAVCGNRAKARRYGRRRHG